MNFKQSIIVAVFYLTLAVTASDNGLVQLNSDTGLLSFMARSNEALQRNPALSLECFNYYIPVINELATQYETNYKTCVDTAITEHSSAEESTLDKRIELANTAETSCALLNKCPESDSVENIFNCYIQGGSENAKTMYNITVVASAEVAELVEQFRLIENQQNKCTNETKTAYEVASSTAYDNFNSCILGLSEVPTAAPSTEAPTTEDPSTEAPSTEAPTTEAPSTEAPSTEATTTEVPSTEGPTTEVPSTEAPSTEAPSTEAPSTEAPSTEAPTTEDPSTEAPTTEAPSTEGPTTEDPSTEAPSTEAPSTEAPSTEAPSTEAPTTEDPSTEAPTTEVPSTEGPTTEVPSTEAPSTEAPSTEAPSNEPSFEENSFEGSTEDDSIETSSGDTEESGGDTEENKLPEEDLSRFLSLKNLKRRLEKYREINASA